MPAPVSIHDARARARKRVERDGREWAISDHADVEFDLPLHPPSEKAVLADQGAARAWVESWRPVVESVWGSRAWPSAGTQRVPERLILRGADAIAAFAGGTTAREWRMLRENASRMLHGLPSTDDAASRVAAVVRTHARRLQAMPAAEVVRVIGVTRWLADNPADGLRIRHVPLRGVDSKWLAGRRALVEGLYVAITGRGGLGVLRGDQLVRARVLGDELWQGGFADASATASEWSRLPLRPRAVVIVENLETLLAMPSIPGIVAVHGSGYGTAARLRGIGWLESAPRLIYWGDLDSHGFGILHEFRAAHPHVETVLMDETTLLAHRDLWVVEPTPTRALLPSLTANEAAARARIASEGDVRLEQERIPWAYALPRVLEALQG